jgi:uncharacterized membrane protein
MRELLKQEKGDVIVLTAVSFIAILVMVGLVIDGGTLYMTKRHRKGISKKQRMLLFYPEVKN